MKRALIALLVASWLNPQWSHAETCPSPTSEWVELEISAMYPNPTSGEKEWVELSNPTGLIVDLTHYTLEDATHHPMTLNGTLNAHQILRVENLTFQMNNSNETVQLRTDTGALLDEWAYATSTQGEILRRNATDPSPAETEPDSAPQNTVQNAPTTPTLIPELSELMANPEGSDGDSEWIELFNPHSERIDLTGLKLDDEEGGSKPFTLSGSIEAESYRVLYSEETHITLNNGTDHVRLLGASNEILWDYSYDTVHEGQSHILENGELIETESPTPNGENKQNVTVETETGGEVSDDTQPQTNPDENGDLSDDIELSELMPNPEGSDTDGEWIELTNGGDQEVNLGNWVIDDGEGGSKPFVVPAGTVIKPGETLVLPRSTSKISLGNSAETITLTDWNGEMQDEVGYESTREGESYAKIKVEEMSNRQASTSGLGLQRSATWQWISPSPGALNPNAWSIRGFVESFENNSLILSLGAQKWTVQMTPSSEETLLYQPGNELQVQAIETGGFLHGIHTELIASAPKTETAEKWHIPWIGLAMAGGAGFYFWNEWRKNKVKTDLLPILKFN